MRCDPRQVECTTALSIVQTHTTLTTSHLSTPRALHGQDLVILEQERSGQFINNAARLRSQQEGTAYIPPTKATAFASGSMRCNNW